MARYSSLFTLATPLASIRHRLADVLRSCDCDVIYDEDDYVFAREVPGRVSYSRLVTVEVLIDRTGDRTKEVQLNVVVKNEELPLKRDNHCRQMFEQVFEAFERDHQWNLVESVQAT
ncbi:MAG: hypothetical protein AAFY26_14410 [Cyanobacteria bacterium J06638_22]